MLVFKRVFTRNKNLPFKKIILQKLKIVIYLYQQTKGVMEITFKQKDEILETIKVDLNNCEDYKPIIQKSIAFLIEAGKDVKKVSGKFRASSGRKIKFIIKNSY